MRLLPAASALGVIVFVAGPQLAAQARPSPLRATVDLRIDKALPALGRSPALVVGPAGEIIVAQSLGAGAIRGFDSTGRALPWNTPTGNDRDSEIRWVSRLGWLGNTLWVADPGFGQVALLDRAGKVTKSLEFPSWVRPSWADRRKFPVFSSVDPLALYTDGSWLVRPTRERSITSTPEYDKSYSYLMRITENGSVQKVVARLPRDNQRIETRFGNVFQMAGNGVPPLTLWDVSTDGSRIVVIATALTGVDSGTYRVIALGEKGDTIYTRKFPFAPVARSQASIDSVRSRVNRIPSGARSIEDARDAMVKDLPWAYAPIEFLVVGRDQSVWIGLRPSTTDRTWVVLDASGASLGTLSLPKDFVVRAADRQRVWGFERDADRVTALVRYKLSAAPAATKR